LLRNFVFIAEDLDQFTFFNCCPHGGWRGEELIGDLAPSLELIGCNVSALTLRKPECKDSDRLPAQKDNGSEAAGFAFAGASQPLFINASAKFCID
jgi:hypothetical protein